MSDVLLGQAYYLRFDPKLWEAMQPYPPLGTLYAASLLRANDFDVALFDAMLAGSESEWADALDRHRPRFAVLFEDNFNYLSKMCLLRMREAAFLMIRAARARGCTVVVCGADASDNSAEYAREGAHFVIAGEGEATLLELLEMLDGRTVTPLDAIQGLAFGGADMPLVQLGNGTGSASRSLSRRPVLRDLDALPVPAWELIDADQYRRIWRERHGYYSVNVVTTRGCPYHCNWCAKPIWGQRYNVRSPENVVSEIDLLVSMLRPDHLWFMDDIFGLKPGWIARFAALVEGKPWSIPFKCLSRPDLLLRDGDIPALARAGCEVVWMGAESGSQKILDAMEKGTTVEQIKEAARRLRAAGIRVAFFIQFGYPGESLDDIEATLRMVRESKPDEIGISVSYPLPGTKFHDAVKEELGKKQNWIDSNDLDMMYRGPFTTVFYRKLHGIVHKEHQIQRALDELQGLAQGRSLRRAMGLARRIATLPFDRRELRRLAELAHEGLGPLPRRLSREEASRPSPQPSRDS